jgi:hypothetical protein
MRSRHNGYTTATARAMARRTAKRENARRWFFDEGLSKEEIMGRLCVTRTTLNLYLRERATLPQYR